MSCVAHRLQPKAPVSTGMVRWLQLCRRLARTFGRGKNRMLLSAAYKRNGLSRCPKIMVPTRARMVVHWGKALQQSFRHHTVRCDAVQDALDYWSAHTRRAGEAQRRLASLSRCRSTLTSWCIFLPLLVMEMLHAPQGFQTGLMTIQVTKGVFFRLHATVAQLWWHLAHLGFPQWRIAKMTAATLGSSGSCADSPMRRGFRCGVCGLLMQHGATMVKHMRESHAWLERLVEGHKHRHLAAPQQVLRPAHVLDPAQRVDLQVPTSFSELARGLDGATPPPLEVSIAVARCLQSLVEHVDFADRPGFLSKRDWCRCACVLVPRRIRSLCPQWWRVYPAVLMCGTFHNRHIIGMPGDAAVAEAAGEPGMCAGSPISGEAATARHFAAARVAAEFMTRVLEDGQTLASELAAEFDTAVISSHGDHIPLWLRNEATFCFWLPSILFTEKGEDSRSGAARLQSFVNVAKYFVSNWQVFAWPDQHGLGCQYERLMDHWRGLMQDAGVRAKVLTGKCESGRNARPSSRHFDWEAWWAMVHTNPHCVPSGTEACFAVFHGSGSWGTSEAHAESVGSILKRYSRKLSTTRVVAATQLRSHGVQGDGSDDTFIAVCWAKFFGSGRFRFETKKPSQRRKKFPQGHGSKTLHGAVAAASQRHTWSMRDVRLALQERSGARQPSRTLDADGG